MPRKLALIEIETDEDSPGLIAQGMVDVIARALKKEGDRRAAEMRERAACEAGLYDVAIAATIRTLPLSPE